MWISKIITFLILVLVAIHFYKTKKALWQLIWVLTIFAALFIIEHPNIKSIIVSPDKIEIIKEVEKAKVINEETKKLAVKTADLVALMSSYTGWGLQTIPIKKERLNFYKSALEGASELIRSGGKNPNDFQSIKELKGVVIKFEHNPNEEPVTRPSSKELQSIAEKSE